MRRRSSKYGERTNVGTRAFGILFGIPLVGLFIILTPVFWPFIISLVLLIVGVNELVKHRRVKKDGTWEWCREDNLITGLILMLYLILSIRWVGVMMDMIKNRLGNFMQENMNIKAITKRVKDDLLLIS